MRRLILLAVVLLSVSCSNEEENSNEQKCYVVTEKHTTQEKEIKMTTYFVTLSNGEVLEVTKEKYNSVSVNESLCFDTKQKY